eukprot:scaffold7438_cov121-Amphora_coffeaeformis.AAC.1
MDPPMPPSRGCNPYRMMSCCLTMKEVRAFRCRTELVPQADRCFILTGAYSLSGPRDVTWAVPIAQQATERVLNQQHALDNTHPLVQHVLYLDDISPDDQPWLFDNDGGLTTPPVLINNREQQDARRITSGWSWVVIGASVSIVVCAMAFLWRRRTNNNNNSSRSTGCCNGRRTGRHPERITRGYMAYPSPDPSPRKQSIWMAENPAVPSSDDEYYMVEEPVNSFDPVFSPGMSSLSDEKNDHQRRLTDNYFYDAEDQPHDNYLVHDDGSFPVAFPEDIPPPAESVIDDDDQVAFAASFCDDDDDDDNSEKWHRAKAASSPDSGWLRDLV